MTTTIRYDLHSHSTASDGTLAPAELVRHAAAQGVHVLALTDHDVTVGLAEARTAAAEHDVRLIPGVEISVTWHSHLLHILGLRIDPNNADLQRGLKDLRAFREWRAEEMARRLEKAGIDNALEGAKANAGGAAAIGRTHFARYLVQRGAARDMQDAFRRYLTRGRPGYVPGQWADLREALGWICAAGGQPVIAHPGRYKLTLTKLRALITEFKDHGGVGIEVVSGTPTADEMGTFAAHARSFGLRASAGSDYHGPGQSVAELGRIAPLPAGCVPVWHDWEIEAGTAGAR